MTKWHLLISLGKAVMGYSINKAIGLLTVFYVHVNLFWNEFRREFCVHDCLPTGACKVFSPFSSFSFLVSD